MDRQLLNIGDHTFVCDKIDNSELNNINSNIEIIEEYKNANTKLLCKCKIDGYEWYSKPSNLLQGRGCPKCSGRIKTHEEFIEEMKIVNPTSGIAYKQPSCYLCNKFCTISKAF